MRKTLAQLILLLAFVCIAWIALQTVWKSTAPIPEGFVSRIQIGDSVILKGEPNPGRPLPIEGYGRQVCLDLQPKGSVGKVFLIIKDNVADRILAVECANSGAQNSGIYYESDLIKYSEATMDTNARPIQVGDDVTLNDGPNPNRARYAPDDGKCLDFKPAGSAAKVLFIGNSPTPEIGVFAHIQCKDSSTGYYTVSDLKKYSEQALAPKVAYKATYKANTLTAPTKRSYQCEGGYVSGIKRADQCRCLPGYVPYKTDCGTYTCQNTSDSKVTRNCY